MSIVVTTPTGNIGSRVVERLLESGASVRVLARRPEKLPAAVREGAEVRQGTLEDAAFLREATAGAEALFLLVPPPGPDVPDWAEWQLGIGRAAAEAVRANGVRRVVLLSSGGAGQDGLYAISRLGEIEKMLEAAAPDVVSLRAGFFMENFFSAVPTIRQFGAAFMQFAPETRLPVVATRDIGDVAAGLLLDGGWSGHQVHGVYGPQDLSLSRVAETLSTVLERPVAYVQATAEQTREALLGAGMGPVVSDEYPRMFARLAEVGMEREGSPVHVGPTSLEQWAREALRPAVEAAAAEPVPA